MIVPVPYVHAGIGFLTILLSIPLLLRKVPMNCLYGIRIKKAFCSDHNWYELNAYGGKSLLIFGLFLLVFGWISRDFAPAPTSAWTPVFLLVPLSGLIPIIKLINAFARHLPEGNGDVLKGFHFQQKND
jgi:hypothetical protein